MLSEQSTDLQEVGEFVKNVFITHADKTGNEYQLEIEPGTYLSANCGSLIAEVDDVVDTGANGYEFLKLNTGMDTITRPALYGSEHPIVVLNDATETRDYVICGHCCESGDVFTVDDSDTIYPRKVNKAELGDLVVIEGAGAYCAAMSLKNYNSFPTAPQLLLDNDGTFKTILGEESLETMFNKETIPDFA